MRPRLARALCTLLLAVPAAPMIGCATDDDTSVTDDTTDDAVAGNDFEAVPRPVTATERAARRAAVATYRDEVNTASTSDSFYLAIKKSALGERFFLSGYLEQYFPGAVAEGAATTLGTRVVSFRIQNGKLYVFDTSAGLASSDTFKPELIVDAFPIVDQRELKTRNGKETYVVIDPAAGLNRFNLVSDSFGSQTGILSAKTANRFEIELAFSQAFRAIDDGATWQLVFTGYGDRPLEDVARKPTDPRVPAIEPNVLHASGTLGMSLRRYRESEQYRPLPMAPLDRDPAHEYFFRAPARLERNSGRPQEVASHWAIHPGMKPIEWIISPEIVRVDNTPEFADVDLVGTVKTGVETWNQAFGFKALTARVARPGESFGQDDKNFIVLDQSAELSFAFADWRTNPSTGETRGASVYVSASFLDRSLFEDDAPAPAASATPSARVGLSWDGLSADRLCAYDLTHLRASAADAIATAANKAFTGAQKFERVFGQLIAHEVGHTLGLRHNFKGSLIAPTSSVMDYTLFREAVAQGPVPGAYDVAAVRLLYGLSTEQPTQPFCTDEQVDNVDKDEADAVPDIAECQVFDRGADPLSDFHAGDYAFFIDDILSGGAIPPFLSEVVNGLLTYAQVGTPAQATTAWTTAITGVGAPLDEALRGDAAAVEFANKQLARVLDRVAARHPAAIDPLIVEQAILVARNVDGVRTAALRRQAIDTLEKLQSLDGLDGLRTLRGALSTSLGGDLGRAEALIVADLVARIDRAMTPYFD